MRTTRWASRASAAARFTATVVARTPGLPPETTSMRGAARAASAGRATPKTSRRSSAAWSLMESGGWSQESGSGGNAFGGVPQIWEQELCQLNRGRRLQVARHILAGRDITEREPARGEPIGELAKLRRFVKLRQNQARGACHAEGQRGSGQPFFGGHAAQNQQHLARAGSGEDRPQLTKLGGIARATAGGVN